MKLSALRRSLSPKRMVDKKTHDNSNFIDEVVASSSPFFRDTSACFSCASSSSNQSSSFFNVPASQDKQSEADKMNSKDESYGVELVRTYIRMINKFDLEGAQTIVTDDFICAFYDSNKEFTNEMTWNDLKGEMSSIFTSFPDHRLQYKRVRQSKSRSEVIIVEKVVVSGSHTGKAFAYGPFEPVQPTGKLIVNDPEHLQIQVKDGKICHVKVYAKGQMTGPAGLYTQAGGFPLL